MLTDDGTRLACTDYGDPAAPHTVVFLHGLCLNSTSWTQPHRPGSPAATGPRCGSSPTTTAATATQPPPTARSYTINRLAADLSDVLRALRVHGPLTLVGHSMGGMTALAYLDQPTDQRPVEPTGLVLIATAAGKLTQHGLGRLLAAPGAATLLHRAAQAPEKLLSTLVKPICTLLSHLGDHLAATTLASVTLNALTTTPPRTALGFLPALRTYNVLSDPSQDQRPHRHRQRRPRSAHPGRAQPRPRRRNPRRAPHQRRRRRAHAAPASTRCHPPRHHQRITVTAASQPQPAATSRPLTLQPNSIPVPSAAGFAAI